jgi:hypothetical protein
VAFSILLETINWFFMATVMALSVSCEFITMYIKLPHKLNQCLFGIGQTNSRQIIISD